MPNVYIPPPYHAEPKIVLVECGPPFVVRWAGSGGRRGEGLQVPSFGCLILPFFPSLFIDAIVLTLSVSRCYCAFYIVVIVVVAVFKYTCFLLFHLNRCESTNAG